MPDSLLGQLAPMLSVPDGLKQKSFRECPRAILMGIPSGCGGGTTHAPHCVRAELLELPGREDFFDLGDVRVISQLLHDQYLNAKTLEDCRLHLYGDRKTKRPVSPLSIAEEVLSSFYSTCGPLRILGLGGDNSVSYPLIKTYLQQKHRQNVTAAILRFSAACGFKGQNPIELSANSWYHSPLEHFPSQGLLVQIGVCDDKEQQYSAEKIARLGFEGLDSLGDTIATFLRGRGVRELYASFDMSVLGVDYARAIHGPQGKLSLDPILVILKKLTSQLPLTGADVVGTAPFFSKKGGINPEPDATLAIGAIVSNFFLTELNRSIKT